MRKFFHTALRQSLSIQAPATGIGLLRCLYGVIVFQEIIFLLYFNALIFDPIPYLEVAFPLIPWFLCLWGAVALCLITGLFCQTATIANYCFWLVFVSFTPMRHDFDGGFDQFMTGIGFLLIFLPVNRFFALDKLRFKLRFEKFENVLTPTNQTLVIAYYLPVIICLGFLYFDSAIHKLFAEHWRNGLGTWLPSTSPYYISALDLSWLLNIEPLQMLLGYSVFVFQFLFLFLIFSRRYRVVLLLAGVVLHTGITVSLNIYPFGLSMLICYVLLVPFSWWRSLTNLITCKHPSLSVLYNANCFADNRAAIIIQHFDITKTINIKPQHNQQPLAHELAFSSNLIAIDHQDKSHVGLNAWIQIFIHMRYSAMLGWFLLIPGIHYLANLKFIAYSNRKPRTFEQTIMLDDQNKTTGPSSYYQQLFEDYAQKKPKRFFNSLSKTLILVFMLQLNSTLHYAIAYRLNYDFNIDGLLAPLTTASNSFLLLTHTFLGITPHALYLHDHFEGYEQILAITYIDDQGQELWLPFVNPEGRLLAPNWGRVQSMWANVAVTPHIDHQRLAKFIMKVTAFWGTKIGADLNQATFNIKSKTISTPFTWEANLRHKNLQGDWQNMGTVKWQNFRFFYAISAKNMQK